jgi:hypothetical protein
VKECKFSHCIYLVQQVVKKILVTTATLIFCFNLKKDEQGLSISGYDYFDLMFGLEKITGKKVDLVAEDKVKNKFFLSTVNKEKIKIYES